MDGPRATSFDYRSGTTFAATSGISGARGPSIRLQEAGHTEPELIPEWMLGPDGWDDHPHNPSRHADACGDAGHRHGGELRAAGGAGAEVRTERQTKPMHRHWMRVPPILASRSGARIGSAMQERTPPVPAKGNGQPLTYWSHLLPRRSAINAVSTPKVSQ